MKRQRDLAAFWAQRGTALLLSAVVVAALALSACQPVMPEASSGSTGEATAEATAAPTEEAAEEATVEPTVELILEDDEAGDVDAVVAIVTQQLADELQVDAGTIEVVSTEAVEWPDSCLGVSDPNVMCAMVITPGFRVVLSADGTEYEYHTNGDGSSVIAAPSE